jgi:hypothetical protein
MAWNPVDEMVDSLRSRWSEPREPLAKQMGTETSEDRRIINLLIIFVMRAAERDFRVLIIVSCLRGKELKKLRACGVVYPFRG